MTNGHDRSDDMTPESLAQQAREWAVELEERTGQKLPDARETVARHIGVSPGTLERLRKRRLKNPGAFLYLKLQAAIREAIIHGLQREATRLEAERHLLVATGADPRSDDFAEVAADLAKVRRVLGLGSKTE